MSEPSYGARVEPVGVFDRQKCEGCGKPIFIQRISFGGMTLSEEEFWKRYPTAKRMRDEVT